MSDSEEDEELNQTALVSSEDPDVLIVVGEKEFREYRQTHRCWSGYFDAAFRSGMKESKSHIFRFPDKDPEEWELVASLVSPLSPDQVTDENVYKVLPWFDELECTRGLTTCDKVLSGNVKATLRLLTTLGKVDKDWLDDAFDVMPTAIRYHLSDTLSECCEVIEHLFTKCPEHLHLEHLKELVDVMGTNEEVRNEIWEAIKPLLPSSLSLQSQGFLLADPLFPSLLHSEIHQSLQKRKLDQIKSELLGLVHHTSKEDLRKRLRTVCGNY